MKIPPHAPENAYRARYWQKTGDEVVCLLCPRSCKLEEGERGKCYVRARRGGELVLDTYGRSSGFAVDPIEKKPLYHYYPGSPILSFGTAGCNLSCSFCQNWSISKAQNFDRLTQEAIPKEIALAAKREGIPAVAFTYNDPVIFLEYAADTARFCHEMEIRCVAVTAGYINKKPRREFFSFVDAANIDLKGFTESFYQNETGASLKTVLDTLVYVREKTEVWLEITTLLIPGYNDSPREIKKLTQWVAAHLGHDTPLHFSAFHPDYRLIDVPPTPASTLQLARDIGLEAGLRYVYTGNIQDAKGQATYCPHCQKKVIERDWYKISSYHIKPAQNKTASPGAVYRGGACAFCGGALSGHFSDQPGKASPRPQYVELRGENS